MPEAQLGSRRSRIDALDGIRGVAIVLVVLSHGWTLFPLAPLRAAAPADGLFHAGNLGVSVFLVVGGFVVTRSLLARSQSAYGLRPWRYYVERFVRIGVEVYPLLLVILLISRVDHTDPYSAQTTGKSVLTIATFTWNWYLQNNALAARSDLGHMWYLSVQEQFYVALVLLVLLLSRRRRWLAAGLAIAIVVVTIWRAHSYDVEGVYRASLRTTTRMDGLLWGALAALVVEHVARLRRYAGAALTLSLAGVAALVLSSARFGDHAYYTWQGVLIDVAVSVFVLGAYHVTTPESPIVGAITWAPLARLGTASLAIYVWHYPIFWFVARHTHHWHWFTRTALGLAILVVVVVLMHKLVDEPTRRRLRRFATRPPRRHRRARSGTPPGELPAPPQPVGALQEGTHPVV